MHSYIFFDTPIGPMYMIENGRALTHAGTGKSIPRPDAVMQHTDLLERAKTQILDYLNGERKTFDLPIDPRGTLFQSAVWQALRNIPYGETRSYSEIATAVGRPKSARAVGMANNKNPLMIITPCHRVLGANGELIGYAAGIETKRFLLNLEAKHV